ncbi:hypothetical protein [Kitasatospora aureofaciens]|uniref:hypothetical protein n=1 Tax=Kitasatospora aureofaciens TaxID=1894 RepID=UPI0037C5FD85
MQNPKNTETASTAPTMCVEVPAKPGTLLPLPAVLVVVIVLGLSVALTVRGMSVQTVMELLAAAGLLGVELVRRLVEVLGTRRAR